MPFRLMANGNQAYAHNATIPAISKSQRVGVIDRVGCFIALSLAEYGKKYSWMGKWY